MRVDKRKKEKILKRKRILFILLIIASLCILFYVGSYIVHWLFDSRNLEKEIADIEQIASVTEVSAPIDDENVSIYGEETEKETSPYWSYISMDMLSVDFSDLKAENNDTVAWVKVNGTNINYPVVQSSNNKYYLKHSFKKSSNRAGWIFMDYRNNITNFDKNTIIYGHNRADSTMFGSLRNVLTSNWLNNTSNHVVMLSTETENSLWQVFSVYHISTTDDYLQTQFSSDTQFLNFINMLKSRSIYNFDTTLTANDKILTLSTCYGNDTERTVLHAKLIKTYSR